MRHYYAVQHERALGRDLFTVHRFESEAERDALTGGRHISVAAAMYHDTLSVGVRHALVQRALRHVREGKAAWAPVTPGRDRVPL